MKCTKIWRVLHVLHNLLATWENESYNSRSISFRLEKNAWIAVSKMKRNSSRLWRSKWHREKNWQHKLWCLIHALIRYKENCRRQIVWTRERLCCFRCHHKWRRAESLYLSSVCFYYNIGNCTLIVRRDDPIQNVSSVGVFAISLSFTIHNLSSQSPLLSFCFPQTMLPFVRFFLFVFLKQCYQWSFVQHC